MEIRAPKKRIHAYTERVGSECVSKRYFPPYVTEDRL